MLKIESLAMRVSAQVIGVGAAANAELFARYENGDSAAVLSDVQWSSSDAAIVSVDESGVLTGVAMGEAVITATHKEMSAATTVVVVQAGESLVAVLLSPDGSQLEVGKSAGFTAKGIFGSGTQYDITQSVTWSSSNEEFVTIDSLGLATGIGAGLATISAQLSGVQGMTALTIIPPKELVSLSITAVATSVYLNETIQLSVTATYNDQSSRDVTSEVTWTSAAAEIATVDSAGKVTGVAVGEATITAELEGKSAVIAVSATDGPTVTRLTVDPTTLSMSLGDTAQLTVTADYSDGTRVNVTAMSTWMSSDASVISVSASGMTEAHGAGMASITASFRGQNVTVNGTASTCAYPAAGSSIRAFNVLPQMNWVNAFDEQGNQFNFSVKDFYCDAAYSQYTSIHFLITAEWCPYCPDYLRAVNNKATQIEAAGGKLVYVEVETTSRVPATSAQAHSLINGMQISGPGYRVGDGETMPTTLMFGRAVSAFPSMFVIRKSDMMVVSDDTSQDHLGLATQIAGGGSPMPPAPNCGASDEETYEPNDDQNSPATLMAGADFTGGICTPENQDWYFVDHAGSWTVDLTFTNATGDLDMAVWSPGMIDIQNPSAVSDSTDDNEQITFTGPGVIVIVGYQSATAPYRLQVTGN
jgi:uncharacterized protein YjdB